MKILVEFPKLEVMIEEAAKAGFTVDLPIVTLKEYQTKVHCNGITRTAFVFRKGHGEETRFILDTHRWGSSSKTRFRVSVGRRINIIGNKLKWAMSKLSGDRDTDY